MSKTKSTAVEYGSVSLDGSEVPYSVQPSRRARRVRLVIGPEPRVRIVVPWHEQLTDIAGLLFPHRRWIFRHLQRVVERASRPTPALPDTLPFRGADIPLEIKTGRRVRVSFTGESMVAQLPPGGEHLLFPLLERWYREEARRRLTEAAQHWSRRMGLSYRRLFVKDQRTRWGSCSSLGNLNFSFRLLMAPDEVMEYVVIHELMHLREANHGPNFWAGVEQWCPNYRDQRAWLYQHGSHLSQILTTSP